LRESNAKLTFLQDPQFCLHFLKRLSGNFDSGSAIRKTEIVAFEAHLHKRQNWYGGCSQKNKCNVRK
jgi:hypothetical protein